MQILYYCWCHRVLHGLCETSMWLGQLFVHAAMPTSSTIATIISHQNSKVTHPGPLLARVLKLVPQHTWRYYCCLLFVVLFPHFLQILFFCQSIFETELILPTSFNQLTVSLLWFLTLWPTLWSWLNYLSLGAYNFLVHTSWLIWYFSYVLRRCKVWPCGSHPRSCDHSPQLRPPLFKFLVILIGLESKNNNNNANSFCFHGHW